MTSEAPNPRDVGKAFFFKQSRGLQIEPDFTLPEKLKSSVTASSKYGLVFVAFTKGVKVFNLKDVISLGGDKILRKNATCEDLKTQVINLNSHPLHVALSCDDLTLAVCYKEADDCCVVSFYDIRALVGSNNQAPFAKARLSSSPNDNLVDFIWNPTVNIMFATCLESGILTIYEIKEASLNICASLQDSKASAICWSPKGKQIVAGQKDGKLIQFKPNLQVAKIVPGPTNFQSPPTVLKICWLSAYVFANVYKLPNSNETNIMIVNSPKNGPVTFINYEDPMMSSGTSTSPCLYMSQISEWNMMIIASNTAVETSVIGQSPENKDVWEQWILEDTGRADLPTEKFTESYATGFAIACNAINQIHIHETLTVPPMPILLLMSTSGILSPFHIINANPGAAVITKPSEPLSTAGMRPSLPTVSNDAPVVMPVKTITTTPKPPIAAAKKNLLGSFEQSTNQASVKAPLFATNMPSATFGSKFSIPQTPTTPILPKLQITEKTAVSTPDSASAPSPKKLDSRSSQEDAVIKKTKANDDIIHAALLEEAENFEKELLEMRQKHKGFSPNLGSIDEKKKLKEQIQNISVALSGCQAKLKQMNEEIHNIRSVLLGDLSLAEEARSIEFRSKDKKYLHLLKSRGLNPIAKKQKEDITKLHQYVDLQLKEVRDLLELQWKEYLSQNQPKLRLPSIETVYKTLKNMNSESRQKKIELTNLSNQLKNLNEQMGGSLYDTCFINTRPMIPSSRVDKELSQMADSLLNITKGESNARKSLPERFVSPEKQSGLCEMLGRRKVTPARSSQPEKLTESRFLESFIEEAENEKSLSPAKEIKSRSEESEAANNTTVQSSSTSIDKSVTSAFPNPITSTPAVNFNSLKKDNPLSVSNILTSTPILPKTNLSEISKTLYENITPPDTPAISISAQPLVTPKQPSLLGLLSGGSTTSAFSAPFKPSPATSSSTIVSSQASKFSPASSAPTPTFASVGKVKTETTTATSSVASTTQKSSAGPTGSTFAFTSLSMPKTSAVGTPEKQGIFGSSGFGAKTSAPTATFSFASSNTANTLATSQAPVMPNFSFGSIAPKEKESGSIKTIPATKATPAASTPFSFSLNTLKENQDVNPLFKAVEPASVSESVKDNAVDVTPTFSTVASSVQIETKPISFQTLTTSATKSAFAFKMPEPTDIKAAVTTTSFSAASSVQDKMAPLSTQASSTTESTSEFKLPESTDVTAVTSTVPSNPTVSTAAPFSFSLKSVDSIDSESAKDQQPAVSSSSGFSFASSSSTLGQGNSFSFGKTSEVKTEQPAVAATNNTQSSFAAPTVVTPTTPAITSTPSSSSSFVFSLGPAATTSSTFGSTSSSSFSFGNATVSSPFDQSAASTASQPTSTSVFGAKPFAATQPTDTLFGATATSTAPAFPSSATTNQSVFGNTPTSTSQSSGFIISQTTSAFGFTPQTSSTFGNSTPQLGQSSGFGAFGGKSTFGNQLANSGGGTFSFASPTSSGIESSFGGGGFGLGSKPSAESANKNVFGSGTTFGGSTTSSIFGNQSPSGSSFGTSNQPAAATQSSFGFGSQASPKPAGGFGGAPAFGGSPSFGGTATFESSSSFGSKTGFGGSPPSSHTFGSGGATFGSGTSAPNFGNLANQSSQVPSFGSVSQQTEASPTFGGLANQQPAGFGAQSGFGSPTNTGFGNNQSFGSPGFGNQTTPKSNAFSQWR